MRHLVRERHDGEYAVTHKKEKAAGGDTFGHETHLWISMPPHTHCLVGHVDNHSRVEDYSPHEHLIFHLEEAEDADSRGPLDEKISEPFWRRFL